ncbi:hypothetical protein PsAD5_01299 [Pseudovibrio sp. Ad5]|uniref:GNAT family N-acetyltransferase n=1 Tax=Pseudovibrio sp. Ad5 TaxID=989436 RepID=UPI0007B27B00|nr:GNAT family N-acetyltransferase [Pseudovibrio sp. Ad5]KZK99658.1 hypothetical protein PsAD5_01299 [Pseudovibrio sp. Ad5]
MTDVSVQEKSSSADGAETQFFIEAFDPEKHDRANFSCGVEQVDNYFKKTANKLRNAGNTSIYVMVSSNGDTAGFYAMNAHAVHYQDLPGKYKRAAPRHGSIPAVYISMIGRDIRYRGQKIGEDLLIDALCRASRASQSGYAAAVIMLDVFDCGNPEKVASRKAIYERLQFQSLPSTPLRMFMPMKTADILRQELGT